MRVKLSHWGYVSLCGLSIVLTGCVRSIATPEAIQQVEATFVTHRPELEELATSAIAALVQSGESSRPLPDRPYYDSAWASVALGSDAIDVEFVIEEFYLPLVYVNTDAPQDVHDTCASGGQVVKQLAPHWYICRRDWN